MHFAKSKLLNPALFKHALDSGEAEIPLFKKTIKNAQEQLAAHQAGGSSSSDLVARYTWMIDQLVIIAWQRHSKNLAHTPTIELLAVGGYGRGELHPFSDVDLLILLGSNNYQQAQEFIESFLRFLWDIGLEIGHSVRSIKDCLKEARDDITIMTNLLEARHLVGDQSLFELLDDKLRTGRIWSPEKFFLAKYEEQELRHARYQGTAYSLEPNIKESPGGLRDLQTILWIYNRHFGVRSFKEMKQHGHIYSDEYRILIRARNILWRMRSGLHLNTKRHEDRLLFDSQRELATEFGYQDTSSHLAVEQLMKRFYRTAKQVIYLNEVLLAHYRASYNNRLSLAVSKAIDEDFMVKSKLIEQREVDLFKRKPEAILTLFRLMQEHKITGIHPDTIRAIRANLYQINNTFRSDSKVKKLFLDLFKDQGVGLTNALMRMNAYGVLGAYIPTFGAIVGQMQHDLFHVYTVDGHTLMVIQNLTLLRKDPDEYPLAGSIMAKLYKPHRLFLGALFHDIAKGRGGDHSVLGESDAYEFCISHGLSKYDAKLVGWLVLSHLMMSHFSQRRDISDPVVIKEFADIVGDIEHLDNLYLLTLADIRGTSPKVWNAWKGQLLLELYKATAKALSHGAAKALNQEEHVRDDKIGALKRLDAQLGENGYDSSQVEEFWRTLPDDYFIRNEPYYIAWHAASLFQSKAISMPIVSVRYSARLEANMFFVFAPESKRLLTQVTGAFDNLDLSIIEAQIQSSNNGLALYSFNAIVPDIDLAKKSDYIHYLEERLRSIIMSEKSDKVISRRSVSRALKHFPIQARVLFTFNNPNYTAMEVTAQDQPGLLHNVALILQKHNIKLLSAKIATFGEKAEDIFFIQWQDHSAVSTEKVLNQLETDVIAALTKSSST